MIQEFLPFDLRNSEYLQFMNSFANSVVRNDPATLRLETALTAFRVPVTQGDALFVLPRESGLTSEIQEQDNRRDTNFTGIVLVLKGFLNHYDPAFRNAAILLNRNIKLYGKQVYNQNYEAESNSIKSMTNDWEVNTELAEAISVLGLRDWSNELKRSNEDFMETYTVRTEEYGARVKGKLVEKRLEIDAAYFHFVKIINARAILDETGAYSKVINDLNALIDQTETTLHNRQARGDNDEEEEEPSEE